MQSCHTDDHTAENDKFHLVVLDPGHFHAALLQKSMYSGVDSSVSVYAPEGTDLHGYLDLISQYNHRADNPTKWDEKVYTGSDYLEKMLQDSASTDAIVVLAGNNKKKTDYIARSVQAGLNVLADKPLAITPTGFEELRAAFATADKEGVLLYDIMTERYTTTNILQKMFLHLPDVFGQLQKGSLEDPSIVFKSVHHFYKEVSGKPIRRPAWYFDTDQQGEGLVDVTTHLVDLVQWVCFPEVVFDYTHDVKMLSARRWPTLLTKKQFSVITGSDTLPAFLREHLDGDQLSVYANGTMNYTLKGFQARVEVVWNYAAPEGGGDTYYAKIDGTKASLLIHQDRAEGYKPMLYIKPSAGQGSTWRTALEEGMAEIRRKYPDITLQDLGDSIRVNIPDSYQTNHEQCFSKVVHKYLQYLEEDSLPAWEKSSMLTKYYTTTKAVEIANQ